MAGFGGWSYLRARFLPVGHTGRRVGPMGRRIGQDFYCPLKTWSSGTVVDPATRGSELDGSALVFCV